MCGPMGLCNNLFETVNIPTTLGNIIFWFINILVGNVKFWRALRRQNVSLSFS